MSLINCKIEFDLPWSKYFKISAILTEAANPAEPATLITVSIYQTNSGKVYAPIVTLPINNNSKFLEHLKPGFKRTISWKRYRSKTTT